VHGILFSRIHPLPPDLISNSSPLSLISPSPPHSSQAQQYAALRRPYLINDVHMQEVLLDRRQVYARLQAAGITVPTHVIINREGLPPGADPPGFEETEDFVAMGGTRIYKPFVEKPSNADDHNIYIYYPHSMGGGVKRLFRKVRRRRGRARGEEEMGERGECWRERPTRPTPSCSPSLPLITIMSI